jgi:hypothetical protein
MATALVSSASPSAFGRPVTYTAHVAVAAPGAGTPSGLVVFLDGGSVLGVGRLNSRGTATLTTRRTLGPGLHHITVVYVGSSDYSGSQSAALTQQVRAASTETRLSLPRGPAVSWRAVTLTARVTVDGPGGVAPAGAVTFRDGGRTLGTARVSAAGVATLTLSGGLAVGRHAITALDGGDALLARSDSGPLTLTVAPAAASPPGQRSAARA